MEFGGSGSSLAGLGGGGNMSGLGGGLSKFTRAPAGAGLANGEARDIYSQQADPVTILGETHDTVAKLKEDFQAGILPTDFGEANAYVPGKYQGADGGLSAGVSSTGDSMYNDAQMDGSLVEYSKHMVPDWGFTPEQMEAFGMKMGYSNIPEGAWLVDDGANYIKVGGHRGSRADHRIGGSFWAPSNFNPNYVGDIPLIPEGSGGDGSDPNRNRVPSWDDEDQGGLARGGIVRKGYAEGGEVIPDKGLTEFEEQLVQGAIQALSGSVPDPVAVEEILAELERTFGEGAVAELQAEMQEQAGPQQPDGMDDRVTANLTPGELVVSNPQLADYGNGDREAGVKKLQQHLADVSKAHRGTAATPSAVDPASMA